MNTSRILIIHPEGNINNNPNLSGIVEILCEEGFLVDVVSPKQKFPQIAPCEGSKLLLFDDRIVRVSLKHPILRKFGEVLNRTRMNQYSKTDYKLIIGVDRDGIIEASHLSRLLGVPYGLISYEIFFRDETSAEFKIEEINACANIDFAICQDNVRSSLLSEENHIPLEKIINIPVAGRGVKKREKTRYLHDKLNILSDKRIALYMGSVANWSMIGEVVQDAKNWPEGWVLVVHNRYGMNPRVREFIGDVRSTSVYISDDLYPTPRDLSEMLHSVDLGIALYRPTFDGIYTGNNLKYLGLSSGKIATYLQHGVPVLTNENGLISDYIRSNKAGYVIGDVKELPELLDGIRKGCEQKGCHILFKEKLDLNLKIKPLIYKIKNMIGA